MRRTKERCIDGAELLSGCILYIFLMSFYGPLAHIELLRVTEMG